MSKLFTPIRVGHMELANRVALAPMTRFRADDQHVPLPFVKDYYAQRGSVPGTLLITEATFISPEAGGYSNVPGIYTDAQITGWKEVTDAVHAKGSYIFMQLWALGRVADPEVLKAEGNFDLVSSSETQAAEDAPISRPLTEKEIQAYIANYARAAKNAIAAGFDGVEIHAANGYLIDQFNQDISNKRTDRWGGGIENRARFALEVVRAVVDAIGNDRTGIRFSPYSTFQGMKMADPKPQFAYFARAVASFRLAYTHVVEARVTGNQDFHGEGNTESLEFFLEAYRKAGPVIVTGGYKRDTALEAIEGKYKDHDVLIGFGRSWVPNPDLVFRLKENLPLVPYDRRTFYALKDPNGYIDYDFSEEFKKSVEVAA
ncbi:uncharacterized protein N7459_002297 [Penicillium hispanicum]|uniref:uncharacterized protein n=1 Tax=Penicillium hispanicum TaxID=1080232 RepID=UPI00253FC4C7|nr:uncharacterized protein N7459_002297 [Penicillium hispanicum]KAJ5591928.1 hypothetical protein N7459_002297 [Penicillium hispanicum]